MPPPYLLTCGLLPIIPKDGRVINLSSPFQAPVDVSALVEGTALDHMSAYTQSKLAITIWTAALVQERLDGPRFIAVNHGSLLAIKMMKEGFGVSGNDLQIGADIPIRAALSDASRSSVDSITTTTQVNSRSSIRRFKIEIT